MKTSISISSSLNSGLRYTSRNYVALMDNLARRKQNTYCYYFIVYAIEKTIASYYYNVIKK